MIFKNVASQKIHVYAYDSTTGAPKTGDAANITGYVSLDGTANAIDDTNPAEVDATNMPGVYVFDLTQAETNCDSFALYAKSSTSNIRIEPIIGFTTGAAVMQTGDSYAIVNHADYGNAKLVRSTTPANTLSVDTNHLVAVPTTQEVSLKDDAITAAKFDESTAFPLKSADTGATAVARTGADSDTLETLSDQLDAIVADTNELQADLANGGRLDLLVDAIKAKTDNLPASPAAIGSAMTLTAAYDAAKTAGTSTLTAQQVWEYATRTLSAFGFNVTVGTNNDKTGYTLTVTPPTAADIADAVWDEALSGHSTAGTTGKKLNDLVNVDLTDLHTDVGTVITNLATVDSIIDNIHDTDLPAVKTDTAAIKAKTDNLPASPAAVGSAMTLTAAYDAAKTAGTSTLTAQQIWEYATRTLSAFGFNVTVGTNNDKTGYTLTVTPPTAADIKTALEAGGSKLDHLWEMTEDDDGVRRLTTNALEQAPSGGDSAPTASEIADAVWDEALLDHNAAGSFGESLAAAGTAGDPWITALPGSYAEGTAGHKIGNLTKEDIADQVCDELLAGHTTSGSLAKKISDLSTMYGTGAIMWTYTLSADGSQIPIADADIWVSTDAEGINIIRAGKTNQVGIVAFFLDAGTYYIWRQKTGWIFTNPDTEVVS